MSGNFQRDRTVQRLAHMRIEADNLTDIGEKAPVVIALIDLVNAYDKAWVGFALEFHSHVVELTGLDERIRGVHRDPAASMANSYTTGTLPPQSPVGPYQAPHPSGTAQPATPEQQATG